MSPYLYRIRKRNLPVERARRELIDALEREGIEGVVEVDGKKLVLFSTQPPESTPPYLTEPVEVDTVPHEELESYIERVARELGRATFRVSVRGVRRHMALEAKLGDVALRANPALRVDLTSPQVTMEVDFGCRSTYVRVTRLHASRV